MAPAVYDQTEVEIEGGEYIFRANGSVLAFDGFYKIWPREENGEADLPELAEGEDLDYHGIKPEQHFSQPPPRYSEATLIRELEQRGIGRPSTYAPIVETIKDHEYVELKERRYGPFMGCSRYPKCKFRRALTPEGEAPEPKLLEEKCPDCGRPLQLRTGRYGEFTGCSGYPECKYIKRDPAQSQATPTGEKCPQCGEGQLVQRTGRFGPF